jgi:plasmid replication initiation protein
MNKDQHRVVKSNLLIESRYRFSLIETKMFLLMIKDISIDDKEFTQRKLYIRDLIEDANIGSRAIYSRIKEISKRFAELYIDLKKSDNAFDHRPIMSRFDYEKGREYIIYKFNEELKDHLLRLKKKFSSYDIQNVINCNSVYSIRIYELLKSFEYEKKKKKTFELSELKKMFNCEDAYKKWADFRRFVLETAKKELKKNSDIYFDFSGIKKGRSVKLVEFTIHKQKQRRLFDNKPEPALDATMPIDATIKAISETSRLKDPEVVSFSEIRDLKKVNVTCNNGV